MLGAVGGTAPGLAIIATGRNARVAWGVTALSADVVDAMVERLSADGKRVLRRDANGDSTWAPLQTRPYDLHFRVLGVQLPVPPFVQSRGASDYRSGVRSPRGSTPSHVGWCHAPSRSPPSCLAGSHSSCPASCCSSSSR